MNSTKRLFILPVCTALLFATTIFRSGLAAAAVDIRDVPVPRDVRLGLISNSTVHNGTQVVMAEYESSMTHEQTIEFYRQQWPDVTGNSVPGMIETTVDGWLLLSRLQDGANIVVQLELADPFRSNGFLSILPLSTGAVAGTNSFSDSSELQLLSETRSTDGPLSSVLSVFQSTVPVESLKNQLLQRFEKQHWSVTSDRPFNGNHIVMMSQRGKRAELVFSMGANGGSMLVVNEVENED